MNEKKINVKSILITCSLILILFFVFYAFIGILISGPVLKVQSEEASVIAKIEKENKGIENIEKHIFKYVTYSAEDEDTYYFFDEEGNKLAIRDKKNAKFEDVKKLIEEEYPSLKDVEIQIGYGKNKPAYIIEKDYELLILNYDNLREVYYMKESAK